MDILSANADVLVVTPFANDSEFLDRYSRPNIKMILPPSYEKLSWFFRKFLFFSSILRVQGYWYRWKKVIPYYWANRHIQFGENGEDKKLSFGHRLLIDALSPLGYSSKTWRIFDFLHGQHTYRFPELFDVTSNYKKVVFIQAASWGYQDAVLGYWARTKKWRSILLPYTIDQLFCNGWLYCNFNKVCVQGACENLWANSLHYIPESNIIKLGSLNSFTIREFQKANDKRNNENSKGSFKILFAGSTATYFPTESEFYCLDVIIDAINLGEFGDVKITYRPFGHNDKIRTTIENRYGDCTYINIEYANPTIYGLNVFENIDYSTIMNNYLNSLLPYDLLVMAGATSLCLDCSFLNIPSICIYIDNSGVLEKRNTKLLFNSKEKLIVIECIPTVFSIDLLKQELKFLIQSPIEREKIVKEMQILWDFPNTNFKLDLKKAIFDS